jgi:tRNA A37 threonylcarbamoyladenosine synthetase subunit TsaC/SUA5/YrdC
MIALASPVSLPMIDDPAACAAAARQLADGAVVANAFANFYVITTRGDAETVRRVNRMKGRPLDQVGSITGSPAALWEVWDLDRLPDGLDQRSLRTLVDTFFALGPFGFRGPAASTVPAQLTFPEGGISTAQVIAPGYACPSNRFLAQARRACGDDLLYITSANRSRHLSGADDSPAHWRADGLLAEFGDEGGFLLLAHPDEAAARARYPRYLPMSTTILGFHSVIRRPGDPRPHLILERHGSLAISDVRAVLASLGFGLVIGPRAETRLQVRDYSLRLSDRSIGQLGMATPIVRGTRIDNRQRGR